MTTKSIQLFRKNLDTSETNLYPLTESQYVLMENGQTVQEVLSDRDSDKYTPVITNSSSTFKVGQGDNVDLSSSMKEGAYDSCVLKGKTMVNCIQESSSQDVVLPYEFEDGQYVTINDTKESGALGVELKGQTLVNLAKVRTATAYNRCSEKNISIKPNTKYIALFNPTYYEAESGVNYALLLVSSVSLNDNVVGGDDAYTKSVSGGLGSEYKPQKGDKHLIFTSKTNETYLHIRTGGNNGILYTDMMILEYQEGMENWDIPYFTGMTSCKMPTLHTVGKNLFDGKFELGSVSMDNGQEVVFDGAVRTSYIKVKPNTTYSISRSIGTTVGVRTYNKNKKFVKSISLSSNNATTFTTPNEVEYIRFALIYANNDTTVQAQLEEGSNATSYEAYKSSILSLPEEVVLRSLPNGVCDTFNTRTGVYTQRIGEYVFQDTENATYNRSSISDSKTETSAFRHNSVPTFLGMKTNSTLYCDKFPTIDGASGNSVYDFEYVKTETTNPYIWFNVKKSKLPSDTIAGFKQWLSQNPITVQYELKTPIVTKINLSSTLKSWNTTTHIYSEIPENTLYPILSHSNPSYPVILKPSTKYSIVANSYSNNHTNSAINFNLGGATTSTTVGNRVTTITTPSTLSNELLTMSGRGNKLNNVMVIEGDVVGDEPYFEGICDCKSPILSNVGENLFNINGEISEKFSNMLADSRPNTVDGNTIIASSWTSAHHGKGQKIKIERGEVYTCSFTTSNSGCIIIHTPYKVNFTGVRQSTFTFTAPTDCDEIIVGFNTSSAASGGKIHDLCVTKTETSVEYKPYKSNILSFDQKDGKTIVLRSLPNGVCDTLNVETGEYVQRIGEVVLDGSYIAYSNQSSGGYPSATSTAVLLNLKSSEPPQNRMTKFVCKDLPHYSASNSIWMGGTPVDTGISGVSGAWDFCIRLPYTVTGGTSTDSNDVIKQKFKEYLNANPVTVQYELATPIVSTIDVQGFPYAYTSGHVQLSSGHSGQSLTPKVEYSLSANKTGQINSNTKRVSAHQKQLDDFEAMMLTSMVQSAYDKAILQFDYEMQMMSLGGE